MRSIVKIRRRMAAVSPFVWARVISGISRPDSAPSTENGKTAAGAPYPFAAVLGHGLGAAARVNRQCVGDQACFPPPAGRWPAGGCPRRATGCRTAPLAGWQRAHRAVVQIPACVRQKASIMPQETPADRVAQQHGGAAVARAPLRQHPQTRRGDGHPHQLFDELRRDVLAAPAARPKAPRTAPDTAINGRLGAKISSAVSARTSCSRYCAHGPANTLLGQHGRRAEAQRRDAQPAQGSRLLLPRARALRRQPRRRHIDARRGERDKHHVQRQNQLVKTHAFTA